MIIHDGHIRTTKENPETRAAQGGGYLNDKLIQGPGGRKTSISRRGEKMAQYFGYFIGSMLGEPGGEDHLEIHTNDLPSPPPF